MARAVVCEHAHVKDHPNSAKAMQSKSRHVLRLTVMFHAGQNGVIGRLAQNSVERAFKSEVVKR